MHSALCVDEKITESEKYHLLLLERPKDTPVVSVGAANGLTDSQATKSQRV